MSTKNRNRNIKEELEQEQQPAQETEPAEGQEPEDQQEAEPEKTKTPKKEHKERKIFGYRLVKDETQKPEKPPKTKWGAGKTVGVVTAVVAGATAIVKVVNIVVDAALSGKTSEDQNYEEKAIEGQFKETYEFPEPASYPSEET